MTTTPKKRDVSVIEDFAPGIATNIASILSAAEETIMQRLKAVNALIADIKSQIVHGTDCITTSQIQEWAVIIPIMSQELTPAKEAFNLTRSLWDIEIKKAGAKNLLELNLKKVEIEQINRIAGTAGETKKEIANYMRFMLGSTQESLQTLGNALRKILDARTANREIK